MPTQTSIRRRTAWIGVCGALALALAPAANGATDCVNVLEYFVGGNLFDWKGSNGTHKLSQNFSSNLTNGWMYYVKFGLPETWEHFTWDSNYIYLRQDGYPTPYTFSAGRWLENGIMCKGDSIASPDNQITWYDSNCNVTQAAQPYPISVHYVDRWQNYNLGGTRGIVDVILVDYYYPGPAFERFFYSKQYGWVRWELWEYSAITSVATWNSSGPVTVANVGTPPKCDSY